MMLQAYTEKKVETKGNREIMGVFESLSRRGHEQVTFINDEKAGLKAIIAIHNTILGPALGGCRLWHYDTEEEALRDALRLSRGMTYKAAVTGLNLGGGKAVIIGNGKPKSEELFRSFGRFVEGLGGRYITAEDVGVTTSDMEWVLMETNFVTGLSRSLGGSGDPSLVTAQGVYHGIHACVKYKHNKQSISGMKVAVQGLGHVGMHLLKLLKGAGCELYAADTNTDNVKEAVEIYDAIPVSPDEIHRLDVDIFAPCALGSIVNEKTIPEYKCKIIAGAANNQLAKSAEHGGMLRKAGILYAPDYVINAGGLINATNELEGYDRRRAFQRTEGIYDTLMEIFKRADQEEIPTNAASDIQAELRLKHALELKKVYVPRPVDREYFARRRRFVGA